MHLSRLADRQKLFSAEVIFGGKALSSGSLCDYTSVCLLGTLTTRRARTGDISSTKTKRNDH